MSLKNCLLLALSPFLTFPLWGQITLELPFGIVACDGEPVLLFPSTLSGGDGNYTYLWSPAELLVDPPDTPTPFANPFVNTTYTLTVIDGQGEEASASMDVVVVTPPQSYDASIVDATCGAENGMITLTGDESWFYFWQTGQSGSTITNLAPGTYCVDVTDNNGCSSQECYTVASSPAPAITIDGTTEICDGFSTTLTANSAGGTAYEWSIGATTSSITVAPSVTTTYSVTVTDFNGCAATEEVTVVVNPDLLVTTSSVDATCGQANGSMSANTSSGVPPYSFFWNNGANTQTATGLSPGNYIVTIVDANGCSGEGEATVNAIGSPITSISIETTSTACGTAEGTATAVVEGGEEPYTYLWNNGGATSTITNLEPGNYRVTVTEASGCFAIGMAQVGDASPVINLFQTTVTDVFCNGNAEGSIDLDVSGGIEPYTYAWNSGQITQDITGLTAGTYSVTVTGANACTTTETFTITEPPLFFIDANETVVTNIDCNGSPTGSINLVVSGGIAPYTFLWSTSHTTQAITGLTAGTYSVWATDSNGCVASETFTINEPTAVSVDFGNTTVTNANCGANNGAIDISVLGGTPPYSYTWNNGEIIEDIGSLSAGLYSVTITDTQGCVAEANFEVDQITNLSVDAGANQFFCEGEEVSLTATASGGNEPYTYLWLPANDNGATVTVAPAAATTYTVLVTDVNGCEASDQVTLEPSLAIDIMITNACEGLATGTIDLIVTGGTGNYTFEWSDIGSTGNNGERTAVAAGSYGVTITDGECVAERTFDLLEDLLVPTDVVISNISCSGSAEGTATVINPQPDYTYQWNNGAVGTMITGLVAGDYCVTITNGSGCTTESCVTISEPAQLDVAILGIPTEPCAENYTLEAVVSGGTAPYVYGWISGGFSSTQSTITGTFEGSIELIITDANGCTVTEVINLEPGLQAVANEIAYLSCNSGLVTLDGTGSSVGENIVYQWISPSGLISDQLVVETSVAGEYQLIVSYAPDALCQDTVDVTVVDLVNDFVSGIDVSLLACNDYRLTGIRPSNYDGPLSYEWTLPDATMSTTETITPNQTGIYTLRTMAIGLGCEYYSTIYIDLDATDCFTINGFVHAEEGETCLLDSNAPTLSNVQIIASGPSGSFSVFTDANGYYEMSVPMDVTTVEVVAPSDAWLPCFNSVNLGSPAAGSVNSISFWLQQIVSCPELSVNLTASQLRRCFTSLYCLSVCNNGTETAENPIVSLILDPFLSLSSASIDPASVDGQFVNWELASLPPGVCQTIYVWVSVSCQAELGQTHCSEASASPSPLCVPSDNWSGTNLELTGECTGGEVQFTVSNTGDTDLSETVNYIVIEDAVAMMNQVSLDDLGGDQEETFSFPANGSTYTFQLKQVDNHPYTTYLSASVEGCGTNSAGGFSTGFVTQYSQITATPATDVFCIENVGAYDPNDKATLPVGYGEQHYIVPETELYYRIRFQNTGTDTAFTVVIRDTLSELLDIRTLEPGNSSHAYELALANERALTFTFNNILLPDSTTNLEASQGFVDFKIHPLADAPLESVIENNAAIYFDFNEPVITNTVFHTLGRDFLEVVSVTIVPEVNINWEMYPNPVSDQLQVKLAGDIPANLSLAIYDAKGQLQKTLPFAGTQMNISVSDLPGGIYLLQLMDAAEGRLLGTAKLIKK